MKLRAKSINRLTGQLGLSLVGLVVVLAIILVVSAVAVPNIVSAMRGVRLRGTASDYAGMLQQARMRAVQDNRIYSVRFGNDGAVPVAYADIYPQLQNGTSGQGNYSPGNPFPRDPEIITGTGINVQPMAAAPSVLCPGATCLQNQVVPIGSGVALSDASLANTPATFSARGLPCTPAPVGAIPPTSCPTNPPAAYAAFFLSLPNPAAVPQWVATTVTPAGRVQTWIYDGAGNWVRL